MCSYYIILHTILLVGQLQIDVIIIRAGLKSRQNKQLPKNKSAQTFNIINTIK